MHHLEDDMDELFRKAAEGYPLNTDGADWESVQRKIEETDPDILPVIPENGKSHNQRGWLLLLLLPLLFICNRFMPGNEVVKIHPRGSAIISVAPKTTGLEKINLSKPVQTAFTGDQPITADKKIFLENLDRNTANISRGFPPEQSGIPEVIHPLKSALPGLLDPVQTMNGDMQHLTGDGKSFSKGLPVLPVETNAKPLQRPDNPLRKETSAVKVGMIPPADSSKKPKPAVVHPEHIYAGIIAGPDISSIKSQTFSRAGYGLGLLIGYRFNLHFSLETGVLWDKKNYHTEGKYFNQSKTGIPYNVNILSLSGNCNMFEIPIGFRYDFRGRPGRNYFATAGVSSYLMKQESYQYLAESGGPAYKVAKSYHNSGQNWLSILQFGVGYEKEIGKLGRLRIEPYLKIPLNGMGIGNLPVTSTGIYIGITRNIH